MGAELMLSEIIPIIQNKTVLTKLLLAESLRRSLLENILTLLVGYHG